MGYIILLILGGALVLIILAAMVGGGRRSVGQAMRGGDVTPKAPGSETANPAASSTTRQSVADKAQGHTPPA